MTDPEPVSGAFAIAGVDADADTEGGGEGEGHPKPAKGYTAVIHVHGMGSQRRYEETSRLIDAVDRHLHRAHHQDGNSLGMLREIKPRSEPDRDTPGKAVTFIRAIFLPPKSQPDGVPSSVRFYEAYWAPVMAGSKSPWGVLKWIVKQALRPMRTLGAPWREHHRLHRAGLADLRDRGALPAGCQPGDWEKLLRHYADFDGLAAKRNHPKGSFADFQAHLRAAEAKNPETTQRMLRLAEAWRQHYARTEVRNGLVLVTILLALLLAGLGVVWAAYAALVVLAGLPARVGPETEIGQVLSALFTPGWGAAVGLAASLAAGLGLTRYLTDYMGDVEAWSTYEETDEKHRSRDEVLQITSGLMCHVLTDPNCNRVVVVSHSLGTSVAHDALLSLRRRNQVTTADNVMDGPVPLRKISHFITLASPVDKINYFFETIRSVSHRYTRVVESLRGDIMSEPFTKNRKPHIHWINFWDEADVISGPIQSPTGRESLISQVDNVHVPCLFFPDPAAAHAAYFSNRRVIATVFEAAFLNHHSFLALDPVPGQGKDYASVLLGPGKPRGRYTRVMLWVLALPWLGLAGVVAALVGAQSAAFFVAALCVGSLVALVAGYVVGRMIAPQDTF